MTPYRTWRERFSAARRRGYSLVEMLIVVSIMVTLIAVTLPVAKKVMNGSQAREASRQLNAYFAMAKARALQTGRPCGLYFPFVKPLGVNDNPTFLTTGASGNVGKYWPVRQTTQVFLAEIPAPYAGSTTNAVGKIWNSGGNYVFAPWNNVSNQADTVEAQYLFSSSQSTNANSSLLLPNEQFLVRFNFKGDWYICSNNNGTLLYVKPLQGSVLPHGYGNNNAPGVPFQILRSPRPIGNALELPQGTCIDITYSGVGNSLPNFPLPRNAANQPLLQTIPAAGLAVMLSPNGAIDSMYVNGSPMDAPAGSLYFLLGKVEKVSDPYNPSGTLANTYYNAIYNQAVYTNIETSNLADPTSLWVTVSRATGQVMTAENMPSPSAVSATPADIRPYIQACRQAAIHGEQMTGR